MTHHRTPDPNGGTLYHRRRHRWTAVHRRPALIPPALLLILAALALLDTATVIYARADTNATLDGLRDIAAVTIGLTWPGR